MNITSLEDYTHLEKIIDGMDDMKFDNFFWKTLNGDSEALQKFDAYMVKIEGSKTWDRKMNQKKGAILEDFAMFLFSRFQDVKTEKNKRPGDNETDIEVTMSQKVASPFIKNIIGNKIICECKNKKSSSIDVGVVVKLAEILPTRGSNFGVFISLMGMGGYAWRFGEGKRKKIMYSTQAPLISFKVDELNKIRDGYNFYTMIREKYYSLLDEVDDETSGLPVEESEDFELYTRQMVQHLKKCDLISESDSHEINEKITKRYGVQ